LFKPFPPENSCGVFPPSFSCDNFAINNYTPKDFYLVEGKAFDPAETLWIKLKKGD